jgi:hypothetical protein
MTNAAWCEGKTTVEQIAESITTNLYEGGRFRYEPSGPMVYQVTTSPAYFNLTSFHNQLTHPNPSPVTVGCADMAWGVRVLANLLGDHLNVMILSGTTSVITGYDTTGNPIYGDRISTKSILPIGDINPTTKTWGYHAVAWRGPNDASGTVYDACLKVYDNVTNTWVLPINMPFTTYSGLLAIASINRDGFYNTCFTNPISRLD